MATAQQKRNVYTVDELRTQLDQWSQADWIRLERAADSLCWGLAIEGKDLLNEMFCRALEGTRKCPTDVQIVVFLIRGMESLVSAYLKKRSHDTVEQAISANSDDFDDTDVYLDQHSHMDTPEEILFAGETLEKIEKLFSDNEAAQMVLMGQLEGYSPQEIQETWNLGPVEYASALRFIRRKLDMLADEESSK